MADNQDLYNNIPPQYMHFNPDFSVTYQTHYYFQNWYNYARMPITRIG